MKILVLFDGNCHLCRKGMSILTSLDWLQKLNMVDFRHTAHKEHYAPDILLEDLDRAMHILIGKKILTGFDAFRYMSLHIPLLVPIAPFLYIPVVSRIGRIIYAHIAKRRTRCTHGTCSHKRN